MQAHAFQENSMHGWAYAQICNQVQEEVHVEDLKGYAHEAHAGSPGARPHIGARGGLRSPPTWPLAPSRGGRAVRRGRAQSTRTAGP